MAVLHSCFTRVTIACLMGATAATSAQTYPARPVRYIVPSLPGGGSDILGRMVAASLTQTFGQQVGVDNRAGGGGNIGAEIAAKAPPDGHTLFQMAVTHAINVSLYRKLSYDIVRDFSPITRLASSPLIVVVHPSLPVRSIGELVKLAKSRPGAIDYASAGSGTPTYLAVELFKGRAGIDLVHVPYKGGGGAQTSVLSGETSVYFANIVTALPHIRQGKLRALAVTSPKRVPLLPQDPTVAESGYPGYQAETWFGLMVPARTAKETIAMLRAAVVSALNSPDVSKRLADLAYIPIGDQPEEFATYIQSEIATLGKVVRALRITAD
jgi:tripartite-type tricarboxylate transporter receptor subunit TctC